MSNKKNCIFLAAGGTGGHLFPAEALGEELISMGYDVHLVTDNRGARFQGNLSNIPVHKVHAATFKAGLLSKINSIFKLILGFIQSCFLHLKHQPDLIIGFGGYPSLPTLLAGQCLGYKTIIHDQNGVLGKANLLLAKRATWIATSFPDVKGIREKDKHKIIMTGNPVRPSIVQHRFTAYEKSIKDQDFCLFVVGGSQGATIFSQVIPEAIQQLPTLIQKRLYVVQQCRKEHVEETQEKYTALGIRAEVSHFFDNIAEIMAKSHLIIARSGASTVAEISTIGRPAIFVPLYHKDQQQLLNAHALTEHEAGWLMVESGFTPKALAAQLETLIQLPDRLESVALKAKTYGRPSAAKDFALMIEQKKNDKK